MPTPDEEAVVAPLSPPIESASLRSSCPPEERHAPRETRSVSVSEGEHTIIIRQQMPTPEPEGQSDAVSDGQPEASNSSREEEVEKGEHIENVSTAAIEAELRRRKKVADAERDSPSPVSSADVPGGSDVWIAQAVSGASRSGGDVEDDRPKYLKYPSIDRRPQPPYSTTSFLRPGSKFKGTQQSDRQVYDVQVEIKDVDLSQSYLCGYLRIQGLTDDHPTLTTFFHSEIIGPHHAFLTTNSTLHSTPKIDLQHWSRFPAFRSHYASALKSTSSTSAAHLNSSFTLKNHLSNNHLFMRWKELFLVPDHRVKSISGASFEGFYYICFDQRVGSVSGIYFHARSEKFQQLELNWVPDGGCVGAVEFR